MRNNFFFIVVILGGLISCTHESMTPLIQDSQKYQQQLAQLNHWQLEAKIAVRHPGKSDSAALRWEQDKNHFDIFISGPLGAGATRISGTHQSLTLHNGEKISTATDDPDHLIKKHLGWELPLDKLPLWITGYSDSKTARFNTDNTLAAFSEHNWDIEYQRYKSVGQWLLPEKIILRHEDMQVTILVKQWTIH